jgi:hypothetical protein
MALSFSTGFANTGADNTPFYVGITFCGNTSEEAILLIDKVKNYTNFFVLQSGPISKNSNKRNLRLRYDRQIVYYSLFWMV